MITYENGHYRSVRTPEEESGVLEKSLEGLSPEESGALREILKVTRGGDRGVVSAAKSLEYERDLVDMHTFIHDEYYLGNTCDGLYPKLEEDLTELFRGNYNECIMTGSIGFGKSFFASIAVIRLIYELSCLKDPHQTLGIAPGTNISVVAFSVNEGLAMKVVLENIVTKVGTSPFFKEHFPYEVTKKELRFPSNIWVAARASTDTSALGLNVISAILDEANFQHTKKNPDRLGPPIDRAQVLYTQIKRRLKSRFERNGTIPGKLFLISSKSSVNDFTERRISEAWEDPHVFVRDYPLWGPKPKEHFSTTTFAVLVGSSTVMSQILSSEEEAKYRTEGIPEGCVLVDVPDNFRSDFESDLEAAIRDIAGVSTVAVSPFIQRRQKIVEMFEPCDVGLFHPFSVQPLNPAVGGIFFWDRMLKNHEERIYGSGGGYELVKKPAIHPNSPRTVHVDIGVKNDSLGLVMVHVHGTKAVERRATDGALTVEHLPMYYVDFVLEVVPPPGGEIYIPDIRMMIQDLANRGYPIVSVTADSYQSTSFLQELRRNGIAAELLSVDKTMDPYQTLKSAIYDGRLKCYDVPKLRDELTALQLDLSKPARPKVDHPANKSKDLSDGLAGAVYSLSQKASALPLPVLFGESRDMFKPTKTAVDDPNALPIIFGS